MKKAVYVLPLAAVSFMMLTGFGYRWKNASPQEKLAKIEKRVSSEVEDVLDDLDADDTQKARISGAVQRVIKQAKPMMVEHHKVKQELRAEWDSPAPNAKRIHATVDERIESLRGFLHIFADAVIQIHQTLTPEQRKELSKDWHH